MSGCRLPSAYIRVVECSLLALRDCNLAAEHGTQRKRIEISANDLWEMSASSWGHRLKRLRLEFRAEIHIANWPPPPAAIDNGMMT